MASSLRVLVGLSALFLFKTAHADTRARDDFTLAWIRRQGAEQCAPQGTAAARVRDRLGYEPFASNATSNIEVSLQGKDDELTAEIVVRGGPLSTDVQSSRIIRSRETDCASLTDAVVLTIAIIIDPDAALRIPPEETPVPAAPRKKSRPSPPPPAPLAHVAANSVDRKSRVSLRPALLLGFSPTPAPAAELDVHAALGRIWSFEAAAIWSSETSGGGSSYRFGTTLVGLGGCASIPVWRRVTVDTCGDLWAGAIHAFVVERQPFAPGQRFVSAFSLTPALTWNPIARLVLDVGFHGFVLLNRYEFRAVGRPDAIFTQPPVAGELFAGVGLAF